MRESRSERVTRRIELVETHNIMLALHRLESIRPYDHGAWRRALYHAIGMACPEKTCVKRCNFLDA